MIASDIAAEQAVLGAILLSKAAIEDVTKVLSFRDFQRRGHQIIFNRILGLHRRGEPADPVTVSTDLHQRGELLRVGGAPYLHTLISIVPTAADAGRYAEIVAANAKLRAGYDMKPLLLDAYCGAGGASMGYHNAGFQVVGVDLYPQPHYPFEFHRCDAVEFIRKNWYEFAAIHTSPVCKRYTAYSVLNDREHPDQIAQTRDALVATGLPWVIENVEGAPLIDPIWLCGTMFNLRTYRHRGFEVNFPLLPPPHPQHVAPLRKMGRPVQPGEFMHIVGHFSGVPLAREIMGMPWAMRDELAQAVPVKYTEYVGTRLLAALNVVAA